MSDMTLIFFLFLLNINLIYAKAQCEITISGSIGDVNATVEHMLELNEKILPKLKAIVERDYFRIFRVNLYRKCRFWPDSGHCVLRDCQVQDCAISEIPIGLRESSYDKIINPQAVHIDSMGTIREHGCSREDEEALTLGQVDTSLDENQEITIGKWSKHDSALDKPFCEVDDESESGMVYVDLLKNVEKYTGYKGESAGRIWSSIYRENCFESNPMRVFNGVPYSPVDTATCKEKRLFFRLMSGLQTSISVQLCYNHLLSDFKGASNFFAQSRESVWGPSLEEFVRRFHPKNVPESLGRLRNLFLAYAVELRAISKIAPMLRQHVFYTGDVTVDTQTRSMVLNVLDEVGKHDDIFDESQLFHDSNKEILDLKEEFRLRFLNITRIMDCVGCDKCKAWGKLQIQGMGTALKILFSNDLFTKAADGRVAWRPRFQLLRTEIVSLFNAFTKLASSVDYYVKFREMMIEPGP